jgi:hypothetical protein
MIGQDTVLVLPAFRVRFLPIASLAATRIGTEKDRNPISGQRPVTDFLVVVSTATRSPEAQEAPTS